MSANNSRIRRVIVDLLFEHGKMTKEGMADKLGEKGTNIPSPHSLSALMAKNSQVIVVGKEIVENAVGAKASHLVYDLDRNLIQSREDIVYTRSLTVMTPSEKKKAKKCACSKIRVFPPDSDVCLHCLRQD